MKPIEDQQSTKDRRWLYYLIGGSNVVDIALTWLIRGIFIWLILYYQFVALPFHNERVKNLTDSQQFKALVCNDPQTAFSNMEFCFNVSSLEELVNLTGTFINSSSS